MKCSLHWLNRYIDLTVSPEEIGQMLTAIGLEVEGIEHVQTIQGGLEGVVTGQVLTCAKHPDADKLSLTTVDIGSREPLQIVCGAPNVAAGQKVLVATTGTTLYPSGGEPLTIKKAKIRGVESNGMICAADELGLGEDHSGIMVLPEDTAIGAPASLLYDVFEDTIFEIGLTPNRSDATCHLGVARDLFSYLKANVTGDYNFTEPNTAGFQVDNHGQEIKVEVSRTDLCPRYTGLVLSGITVGESPMWLKNQLTVLGIKSINNIVDITNYILHDLGQPLHAFDADKIGGGAIHVGTLPKGTKFDALDGRVFELIGEELMICDGSMKGMCIGGVYGGKDSGVTAQTTNIFLESAHFTAGSIRKTSMGHNLRTDAAKVFEKGSDPNMCLFALKKAATMMTEIAGGVVSSEIVDIYPKEIKPTEVHLRYQHINDLLGVEIPKDKVHDILSGMGMQIMPVDDHGMRVLVPTNKSDVHREVDVIEEILRIYGFNQVGVTQKINSTISYAPNPNKFAVVNSLANYLAANGFNEMMGLSLIDSKLCTEALGLTENELVLVNNTSNAGLDAMRPSMLLSGLLSVQYNLNRQQTALRFFEVGKSYRKADETFDEQEELTLFVTGAVRGDHWSHPKIEASSYYTIKQTTGNLLRKAGIETYKVTELEGDATFAYGLTYAFQDRELVRYGEVCMDLLKKVGIRQAVYAAVFNIAALVAAGADKKNYVKEISRFPAVRRDLAIVIDKITSYRQVEVAIGKTKQPYLREMGLFDIYANEELLGTGKKSYALGFLFENREKTLTDGEIEGAMKSIIKACTEELGAVIRG